MSERTDSLGYLERVEDALKQNRANIRRSYGEDFERLWKDFEYGLRDFGSEATFRLREVYKARLKAAWEGE